MKKLPGDANSNCSVLMITYYFPPMGGNGVQRTLKFVKYLMEFGWQSHILTVKETTSLKDQTYMDELPGSLPIIRTPILSLPTRLPWKLRSFVSRWFLIIDEQIGWLPFGISAGLKIIKQGDIKVIYSTSTPYTTHLIAHSLHKLTQLPWVADFRDPWIDNPFIKFPTALHRRINERLEKNIFTTAERVILNTEVSRQHYIDKYFQLPVEKFITIPNGYDQVDIECINKRNQINSSFTIVHLGSLYRKTRSSEFFLKALNEAIRDGRLLPDKIRVLLIGNIDKETPGIVRELQLSKKVELLGYIPHRQALDYLFSADLLLLLPYYGVGAELSIPAKIYEYLASRKPILCLAESGACSDLVLKARAGSIVPPTDTNKIADEIVRLYHLWEKGAINFEPNIDLISSFERRKLAGQLSDLFNGLIT
ncbi:MAG: glycosyltransferase [Anaerolineales bacterium]